MRSFSVGEVYKKSVPDVIAAFRNETEMIYDGYVFNKDSSVTEYITEKENGNYPDLLNREATEYFVKITHDEYAAVLKEYSCENVTAVFTDEPKASVFAFNNELARRYESEYNESVLPYLPVILQRIPVTQENMHIRCRWYDILSRVFCENYLLVCKNRANKNGMSFTGHLDRDHDPLGCIKGGGNFNLMRALRCFDIPGIDVIWRQIYPENSSEVRDDMNGYNGFYPRYASSAAAHNGKKYAVSEIFAVAGAGLTYDIMRYTVGYLAVRGINIFNLFNFPLGRKGRYLAQELPIFTETQPYYRHLKQFNRYMERLSYITSLGERICETALYYPVSNFTGDFMAEPVAAAFDNLGRALESQLVDFDIVDDDIIKNSSDWDKGFICHGKARYSHIVIPVGAIIPNETQTVLRRFVEGGGRISYDSSDSVPVVKADKNGLRGMRRRTCNEEILCLFREDGDDGSYRIQLNCKNGYLLQPENSTVRHFTAQNGILELSFCIGETIVLLMTDKKLDAEHKSDFTEKYDISGGFLFRKELELDIDKDGFRCKRHISDAEPVTLDDWKKLTGYSYSGSCVYETVFTLSEESVGKEGELDLGKVCYSADVLLNDISLGTVLMPPYRLKIPVGVLGRINRLKISVTNTSANRYLNSDFFNKWSVKEISPYFDVSEKYAEDYTSGGLYGPVTLYTVR